MTATAGLALFLLRTVGRGPLLSLGLFLSPSLLLLLASYSLFQPSLCFFLGLSFCSLFSIFLLFQPCSSCYPKFVCYRLLRQGSKSFVYAGFRGFSLHGRFLKIEDFANSSVQPIPALQKPSARRSAAIYEGVRRLGRMPSLGIDRLLGPLSKSTLLDARLHDLGGIRLSSRKLSTGSQEFTERYHRRYSMRFEKKSPEEKEADRILREDTQRRGSGMNVRSPRPGREVLISDFGVLSDSAATYDEYPSDAQFDLDENVRARLLKTLCDRLLTDRQAQSLDLIVLRGWSYGDAAAEMGLAKGTVHDHVEAAVNKLRAEMETNPTAGILFPEFGD